MRVGERGRVISLKLLATLLMQSRIGLAVWAASAYCAHSQMTFRFLSTNTPKSFLQGCFQPTHCPACILLWVCPDPGAGPCLSWTSWGLYGLTSLCPTGWYPVSANQLKVHSVPLSISLTKMLNNTSPKSTCEMPITGLLLDIEPLTTTFWVWPFSQFLIHQVVHPPNPHLSSLKTRMSCRTASNAGTMSNAVHKSIIHQSCNLTVEVHQNCQASFALSEAMLAVNNHLSLFHVPKHSFQEDLLHDLARNRGETD